MTYGPKPRTLRDRFLEKVIWGNGCWGWSAAVDRKGYGLIGSGGHDGRMLKAHRVSWTLFVGPIPDGVCVLHRCDNPPCTRPTDLFLGTRRDNVLDMMEKGRQASVERTRQVGRMNGRAILTEGDVEEALSLMKAGLTSPEIAALFGVGLGSIEAIRSGRNWKHVPR